MTEEQEENIGKKDFKKIQNIGMKIECRKTENKNTRQKDRIKE